jgi:hypothetical protein
VVTSVTPFGGRPATATRDVIEDSDVGQNGCGLFACIVNVHLPNQNGNSLVVAESASGTH